MKYILAFVAVLAIGVVGWNYMQPQEEMVKQDSVQPDVKASENTTPANAAQTPVSNTNTVTTNGVVTVPSKIPPVQPMVKTFTM